MSEQQRVVLVSGANKGIGFEVVKNLASRSSQSIVLLGTRDLKNGEQAIKQLNDQGVDTSNVKLMQLDVSDAESVKAAANKVESEYGHLNVLINNSGIATFDDNRKVAQEVLDVNVTGVQRMNDAFLPLLLKSTTNKPLNIIVGSECGPMFNHHSVEANLKQFIQSPDKWTSSTASTLVNDYLASYDDNSTSTYSWKVEPADFAMKIYCVSKSIVGGYSRWYANQHPEIDVAIVTPGYCATDLNNFSGPRKNSVGAESVVWHIDNQFKSGHFYRDGQELPWSFSLQEFTDSLAN